ncbi:zinc finger protein 624-like [Leguminivora glycinivorella]|uniref:zinc finger protein 624-like n=1 Tax=Leguminivora glycinivorella TaxID=1035111 RepID=UPI00200BFC8B|nr:zinc finger protein 624-like [Leguminivora glycinivorella]
MNTQRVLYCMTCLSQGRQMFTLPLQHIKFVTMFYKELKLKRSEEICWECRNFIIKMAQFRERAIKARSILVADFDNQTLSFQSTTFQTLSNLKISKGTELTIPQRSTTKYLDPPVIVETEPEFDYGSSYMELNPMKRKYDDGATFEVFQHKVSETFETAVELEPLERVYPGVWNASVVQGPAQRQTEGKTKTNETRVWSGDSAGATQTPLLYLRLTSNQPSISAVPLQKPPTIAPLLPIKLKNPTPEILLPKTSTNPTPEINVEKYSIDKTLLPVPIPSGPYFTEERLTEEELKKWWESKREDKHYADSMEMFKCEKCVEPFTLSWTYKAHEKMHTELYGKLSCDICELRFHTDKDLAAHKESHYRLLKCTRCDHTWDSLNSMRLHCEIEHRIPVTVWTCEVCYRELSKYNKYLSHLRVHEREDCPVCGKGIFLKAMKAHMKGHKDVERPFKCPKCEKTFRLKKHFELHVTRVHPSADKMIYCVQCDKLFKHIHTYNHHMKTTRVHISKEQIKHKCSECNKMFSNVKFLEAHVERVHNDRPQYECPVCHEMFKTSQQRGRHRRLVHENFVKPKDKICDHCGMAFTHKAILSSHINTHTGARPFVCKLCGADFGHKSALYLHGRYKHKIPRKNSTTSVPKKNNSAGSKSKKNNSTNSKPKKNRRSKKKAEETEVDGASKLDQDNSAVIDKN